MLRHPTRLLWLTCTGFFSMTLHWFDISVGFPSLIVVEVLRFIAGAGAAMVIGAELALVTRLFRGHHLARAQAIVSGDDRSGLGTRGRDLFQIKRIGFGPGWECLASLHRLWLTFATLGDLVFAD